MNFLNCSSQCESDPPENCHLNIKKLPIFTKKSVLKKKDNNYQFLKKMSSFCQFFEIQMKVKSKFWQFFDIQMAIFWRAGVNIFLWFVCLQMNQVGQAIFTLQDVLLSPDLSLTLSLRWTCNFYILTKCDYTLIFQLVKCQF